MQSSNQPGKISVPFANSGSKQPIPVPSQVGIEDARASYTDGFPPLTRTPLAAGGKPPFGTDMNGILNAITAIQQWQSAGGAFKFDSAFAASVGGYPAGAVLARSDNSGFWINATDGNTADPETGSAGWRPLDAGSTVVPMASANVTLTSLQAARPVIIITGALTASLQLVLPTYIKQWVVINNATGAFSVMVKTAAGSGVSVSSGSTQAVCGDGSGIVGLTAPDASETAKGIIRISTQPETEALVSTTAAITPKVLGFGFSFLFAANGYITLPRWLGRWTVQWGQSGPIGDSASAVVTLPAPFPTECLWGIATSQNLAGTNESTEATVLAKTQTTVTLAFNATITISSPVNYFLIGR